MIRYALTCDDGHAFESWFSSAGGYDDQVAAGLVQCPICGSGAVDKAVMAPAVPKKRNARVPPALPSPGAGGTTASPPAPGPAGPVALLSEREQAVRSVLRAIREHVTRTSDYVGPRFADQARRMHEGEIEHRSIYGEATAADAEALLEDGIEVHPLPPAPDDRN